MTAPPDRRVIIPALGITQIFAWGSTFYLPAALAPLIASDMGWPYDLTVSGVSVALLVAGLASPRVGRLIADFGGRPVLAIGALLLAAGLLAIGTASNLAWYLVGWLVTGLGMSASLYDAAFSTLGRICGAGSRETRSPVHLRRDEYATFALLAAVLTVGASVLSIVGTQLLPLLAARGFEVSVAVAFGAIVGPAQVGARVIELLIGHPTIQFGQSWRR